MERMFASVTRQQRTAFRAEARSTLFMLFVVGPAMLLALAWAVWWTASLLGAPGNELASGFLGDAFSLLVFVQTYVVMVMAIPGIMCMLSDPVETRLAMWALAASVLSLLPQVFCLMEGLGSLQGAQPVPATPDWLRYDVRVRFSVPELRFSPGVSPQLE